MKTLNPTRTIWLLIVALAAIALTACSGVVTPAPEEAAPAAADAAADTAAAAATAEPAEEAASAAPTLSGDRPLAAFEPVDRNNYFSEAPEMTIDPSKYYYATIKTEKGDIKVQLFADRAPATVNNFVFLANQGFYDDTTFHRVIDGFMAQAGDPTGTGAGGPGYQFADEFAPGVSFDRPGLLAMANAGPGTNGSQFFITFAPTDWLNGRHTIFGEVIEGSEILGDLTRRDPNQAPDFEGDRIESITIEETDASSLPTPTPLPPTPTPFPPTNMDDAASRPLASVPLEERTGYFNTAPDMVIDQAKTYQAVISTAKGDMVMDLYDDEAPVAVNNLVVLANLGFFDGMPINEVVPGELVVIGSPADRPDSDAGYQFQPEFNLSTAPVKGSVTYLLPLPDSTIASSSIMLIALQDLPAETASAYSFFGQIVDGVDVLDQLTSDDVIDTITIEESGE